MGRRSGGTAPGTDTAVAVAMKSVLEADFGVPVSLVEDRSRTTYENALYTAQLLSARNIRTVVVITQARDLPRTIWSFERVGLHALHWFVPSTVARIDKSRSGKFGFRGARCVKLSTKLSFA